MAGIASGTTASADDGTESPPVVEVVDETPDQVPVDETPDQVPVDETTASEEPLPPPESSTSEPESPPDEPAEELPPTTEEPAWPSLAPETPDPDEPAESPTSPDSTSTTGSSTSSSASSTPGTTSPPSKASTPPVTATAPETTAATTNSQPPSAKTSTPATPATNSSKKTADRSQASEPTATTSCVYPAQADRTPGPLPSRYACANVVQLSLVDPPSAVTPGTNNLTVKVDNLGQAGLSDLQLWSEVDGQTGTLVLDSAESCVGQAGTGTWGDLGVSETVTCTVALTVGEDEVDSIIDLYAAAATTVDNVSGYVRSESAGVAVVASAEDVPSLEIITFDLPTISTFAEPTADSPVVPFAEPMEMCSDHVTGYYLVHFYSAHPDDDGAIIHSECLLSTQYIATPPQDALDQVVLDSGQRIIGWMPYTYEDGEWVASGVAYNFDNASIRPTEDGMTLVPVLDTYCYIYYVSAGTPVPLAAVKCGEEATSAPTNPTRTGYNFTGWATADGTPFTFGSTIDEDIILTAQWAGQQVTYSVAIWVEKPNLDIPTSQKPSPLTANGQLDFSQYDYVTTVVNFTGTAGDPTTLNDQLQNLPASIRQYFTSSNQADTSTTAVLKYTDPQYAADRVIQGDGSTVINLFASRKVYTYEFRTGQTNYTMTVNGEGPFGNNTTGRPYYTFQAKYQDDVSDVWPTDPNATFSLGGLYYRSWGTNTLINMTEAVVSRRNIINNLLLPPNGDNSRPISFTLVTMAEQPVPFRYFVEMMVQPADGVCPTGKISYNNKCYENMPDQAQRLRSATNAKDIIGLAHVGPTTYNTVRLYSGDDTAGYTFLGTGTTTNTNTNRVYFYDYTKKNLTFRSEVCSTGGLLNGYATQSIPYTRTINPSGVNTPTVANPSCEGYTFLGWYRDSTYTQRFDWSEKMPNNDMAVYARWESTANRVYFYYTDEMDDASYFDDQGVADGATAVNKDDDQITYFEIGQDVPGYGVFKGWFYDQEVPLNGVTTIMRVPFSFDMAIYDRDYYVYAVWETQGYEITYVLDGGTINGDPTDPVDPKSYSIGMTGRVLSPIALDNNGNPILDEDGNTILATRDGEDFYAWQLEGTNTLYYPGQSIRITGPNMVLVALYQPTPKIELTKTVDPEVAEAGQTVTYTFVAKNLSERAGQNLSNVVLNDPLLGGPLSCGWEGLIMEPGAELTCTVEYTVPDPAPSAIANTATVEADSGNIHVSDDDSALLDIDTPSISLGKDVMPGSAKVGEEVTYTFTAKNTGQFDLSNIRLIDTVIFPDDPDGVVPDCIGANDTWSTSLAVDETMVCTLTYTIKAEQVQIQDELAEGETPAGFVVNEATVIGQSPTGTDVSSSASTTVQLVPPTLDFLKSADPTSVDKADTEVTYTYSVTNNNLDTVTDVSVVEDDFTGLGETPVITSCKIDDKEVGTQPIDLPSGKTLICTATYTVVSDDLDNPSFSNTAHAIGKVGELPIESDEDDETVTILTPGITLTKSVADPAEGAAAKVGDTVTYNFVIENTGDEDLTDITLTDEMLFAGPTYQQAVTQLATACVMTDDPDVEYAEPLAPTQSITCQVTYVVQLSDVEDLTAETWRVPNTATANAKTPLGTDLPSEPSEAEVTMDKPTLEFTKTANTGDADNPSTEVDHAGQTVTYTLEVTNPNNVAVYNLLITEHPKPEFTGSGALPAITTCWIDGAEVVIGQRGITLGAGLTLVCEATYQVTQADMDRGSVTNVANASGRVGSGNDVYYVDSPDDTATVTNDTQPQLDFDKSASPETVSEAGTLVTYTYTATNAGPVTISAVSVTEESFSGTGELSAMTCTRVDGDTTTKLTANQSDLTPGQSLECTATYKVTQQDIDQAAKAPAPHAAVTNTAHASGTVGDTPVPSDPDTVTVNSTAEPELQFTKTASPKVVQAVDDEVTYTLTATNTGKVTIDDVTITDKEFSGEGTLDFSCEVGGQPVSAMTATLAPTEVLTCTAIYKMTQADLDAGTVTNVANASGTVGEDPVTTPDDDEVVNVNAPSELTLVKTASPTTVDQANQVVTYTFEVTNTGRVTVTGVRVVEDSFSGTGTLSALTCQGGSPATLAPDQVLTCTATYAVTQADIDAGAIVNVAHAAGTADGHPVKSDPDTATVRSDAPVLLGFTKDADPRTVDHLDQVVTYTFVATNQGEVTVTDVKVVESYFSGTGVLLDMSCEVDGEAIEGLSATLAPNQSLTCTATYKVTQADLEAGRISNVARATGTVGNTPTTSDPDTETVITDPPVELSIDKSADPATVDQAGQTVTYTFVAKNEGGVTVTGVRVEEGDFSGTGVLSRLTCQVGDQDSPNSADLAPGESLVCQATYQVTQADVDAGQVTNDATAVGRANGRVITSEPDDETVTSQAEPGLELSKTSDVKAVSAVDDEINYTLTATNTGGVTLTDVTIADTGFTGLGDPLVLACLVYQPGLYAGADPIAVAQLAAGVTKANLLPGQWLECTGTYVVVQADIDAAVKISNTAVVTSKDPDGGDLPPLEEKVDVEIVSLLVEKKVNLDGASPTDVLIYQVEITNTGSVALDVTYTDTFSAGQLQQVSCDDSSVVIQPTALRMSPQQKVTYCFTTYTVVDSDVAPAGEELNVIFNLVEVTGVPERSDLPPATGNSRVETVIVPGEEVLTDENPHLTVTKTSNQAGKVLPAGTDVLYTITALNDGNVPLTNVGVVREYLTDGEGNTLVNQLALTNCQVKTEAGATTAATNGQASLEVGDQLTCNAVFTVTQELIDQGVTKIINHALARGTSPEDRKPEDDDTEENDLPPGPGPGPDPGPGQGNLVVEKLVSQAEASVGDVLTYSLRIQNTGTAAMVYEIEEVFAGKGPWSQAIVGCVDPSAPGVILLDKTVMPNQTIVCTFAPYTVVAGDIDAGNLVNTVVVTGTPTDGGPPVTVTAKVTTKILIVQVITGGTVVTSGYGSGSVLILTFIGAVMAGSGLRRRFQH